MLSSVKNALRILHSFTSGEPEKGVPELAKTIQISRSAARRLVATLVSEGFLVKNTDTQKYRLGTPILALSNVIKNHLEIHQEALPTVKQLALKTGETAHIGILEGTKLVFMHKIESKQRVRLLSQVGKRVPAYCTGAGKAILAFREPEIVEQIIREGLYPYTKNTITDADALRAQLLDIRSKGYAVSKGEFFAEEEVVAIGSPIRDYTGYVFASIFIVGPSYRILPEKIPQLANEVIKAANEVSINLGYRP